ncbi:MAG: DNA primase [Defluviitaleaceae bacterium]|nr:DNA primase [Defluviitaleaceae bacterium]
MLYSDEIIREVRAQNDIIDVVSTYVPLRMRGGRHWGSCPFHQENTPSFTVNSDTQFFHCFGCGAGGNVITFVMRIEHMDFVDALKLLADRVHFILPQPGDSRAERVKHAEKAKAAEYNKIAARFFHEQLNAQNPFASEAREYLKVRGVNEKVQTLFGLGLSPPGWDNLLRHLTASSTGEAPPTPSDLHKAGLLSMSHKEGNRYYDRFRERLMFPIIDPSKRVVGFGGRIMRESADEAKYLNSPETSLFNKSSQLYALNLARKTRSTELIVVEGYMDVIALFKAGFTNAVGVLGTAITARHVQLLRRNGCATALLLLDSDNAGTAAALKSIPLLLEGGLRVKVLQVPDAKDPDEFLQNYGAERMGKLLANAQSHIVFQIGLTQKKYDMDKTEDRIRFTEEAASLLAPLSSEIETDAYVQETARASHIAPSAIFAEVKKQRDRINADGGQAPLRQSFRNVRKGAEDPGVREARRQLLCLALTHPPAARALADSGCLSPEEMGNDVFSQILALSYQNIFPAPADIVSRFETTEAQQQAAEVFTKPITYSTLLEMEKSLNEMAVIIKRAFIDTQIELCGSKNDLNAVNSLVLSKKNLQSQYITLSNG